MSDPAHGDRAAAYVLNSNGYARAIAKRAIDENDTDRNACISVIAYQIRMAYHGLREHDAQATR